MRGGQPGAERRRRRSPPRTSAPGRTRWRCTLTDAATWGPADGDAGRARRADRHVRSAIGCAGTEVAGAPQRVVIPGLGVYGALTPSLGLLAGVYRGFSPAAPGASPTRVQARARASTTRRACASRRRALRARGDRLLQRLPEPDQPSARSRSCGPAQEGCRPTPAGPTSTAPSSSPAPSAIVAPGYAIPVHRRLHVHADEAARGLHARRTRRWVAWRPGDELPFVPRHQASATVAFETPRACAGRGGHLRVRDARARRAQGPATPAEPFTDPSFILDVTARVPVTAAGQVYVNVRNMLGAEDIAARLPFGARPVAPRWVQVGTKWSF